MARHTRSTRRYRASMPVRIVLRVKPRARKREVQSVPQWYVLLWAVILTMLFFIDVMIILFVLVQGGILPALITFMMLLSVELTVLLVVFPWFEGKTLHQWQRKNRGWIIKVMVLVWVTTIALITLWYWLT